HGRDVDTGAHGRPADPVTYLAVFKYSTTSACFASWANSSGVRLGMAASFCGRALEAEPGGTPNCSVLATVLASAFAPAFTSRLTIASRPCRAARCSGVHPRPSAPFTSAPFSIREGLPEVAV